MERTKKLIAIGTSILLLSLTSCASIKESLPSAPSSEGVHESLELPQFDLGKKLESYREIGALEDYVDYLFGGNHVFTLREVKSLDNAMSRLLSESFNSELFPYEAVEKPFVDILSRFEEGALPKTEKALSEWYEMYEKSLWHELRNVTDNAGVGKVREKYSFMDEEAFTSVLLSLQFKGLDEETLELVSSAICNGWLRIDVFDKTYALAEDVMVDEKIMALLRTLERM